MEEKQVATLEKESQNPHPENRNGAAPKIVPPVNLSANRHGRACRRTLDSLGAASCCPA
jgi:hypothetical protein